MCPSDNLSASATREGRAFRQALGLLAARAGRCVLKLEAEYSIPSNTRPATALPCHPPVSIFSPGLPPSRTTHTEHTDWAVTTERAATSLLFKQNGKARV